MREIFKGRIKWIILISVVVGIGIIFTLVFIDSNNNYDTKGNSKITSDVKEELKENRGLEEQKVEEDKGEESNDVVEKETTTNNTPKTNDKNSSSTNSKPNNVTSSNKTNTNSNQTTTNNNNSVNSNTNSNSNNNISNNTETPKQYPPINKPSEDLTKIANPNDFFYSITGGNVEFSTNAGCMKAGEDIAFIDVVDIQYFRCYEVMSKANTIMGYYLNIFCENGNCNSRYKSMININDYD